MVEFEKVARFSNVVFPMPMRKTTKSAGYDFAVAEDIIIPPYADLVDRMKHKMYDLYDLKQMAALTKEKNAKPSLVSTGVKCKMEDNQYLELSVRSSTPLKYWLLLANGVGRL